MHIYGYFCDLVEQNHPGALGENNSGLPKILDIGLLPFYHIRLRIIIFCDILFKNFSAVSAFTLDAFDDSDEGAQVVKTRLHTIVKRLHQSNMMAHLLQVLNFDEEKRKTLQQLISS